MEIPDFLKRIRLRIDHERRKHHYKNLVFEGGGVRGIAYMGALEMLDELEILTGIQRVAGTSAGAIAATLCSFRLSMDEMWRVFNTLDTTKVPQSNTSDQKPHLWQPRDAASYVRLFNNYGWHSSQYFYHWLEATIAEQCEGDRRATFADFQERGFRDLYIVATNISRHRAEVFSARTTPDVAVADAVRMSMSIPVYFEALRFDGKEFGDGEYYVDGGLYDNYPIHIFDKVAYVSMPWAFRDNVNWETLGLFLYPEQSPIDDEPDMPASLWQFVNLILQNITYTQQLAGIETNSADSHRTIKISDCGVQITEFDIAPGTEKYDHLYQSGRQGVAAFFDLEEETR